MTSDDRDQPGSRTADDLRKPPGWGRPFGAHKRTPTVMVTLQRLKLEFVGETLVNGLRIRRFSL
jgi:hypothetical protein